MPVVQLDYAARYRTHQTEVLCPYRRYGLPGELLATLVTIDEEEFQDRALVLAGLVNLIKKIRGEDAVGEALLKSRTVKGVEAAESLFEAIKDSAARDVLWAGLVGGTLEGNL